MRPSALYSNTIITVKSSLLLSEDKIKRMIAGDNFDEAVLVLLECGYDQNVIVNAENDEDKIIADEMKKCIALFTKLCPDGALLDAVNTQFDYHNARILYKARFDGLNVHDAIYPSETAHFHKLEHAINKKQYTFLPQNMRTALKTLDGIDAPTADKIDEVFNKALLAEMQGIAKKIKSAFVRQYLLTDDPAVLQSDNLVPKGDDSAFGLEKFLKWFILKKRELAIVKTILMGKKLGLTRDKIREMVAGI